MWPKYKAIYDLIECGANRILIRSCNGAGKSTLLASLLVQDITRFENFQGVVTGANASQLQQTLWREMKRLAKAGQVDVNELRANSWSPMDGRSIHAIAPSKIESGQGFHAERVDVIIDEATGMSGDKITALMSNATGADSLVVFTYNPINPDATVFDLEQSSIPFEELVDEDGGVILDRCLSGQWISIGISGFEHPNVIHGREIIKGAITRQYIEDMLRVDTVECAWEVPEAIQLPWNGKAYLPTPEAMARVCGAWTQHQTIGFISGGTVVSSWSVDKKAGLRIAGADIGGGGEDPSVWTSFHGNTQMPFEQVKTSELGVVASMLDKYCTDNNIDAIGIDDTGVGHGVTDRLQEHKRPYKIIPIHFGSAAKNFPEVATRKPANARCEMYLILEKAMRNGSVRILYDKELQRELTSQKIVGQKKSEMIRLEDKMLIKKRIGRSPNKADATAIALYAGRLLQHQNRPLFY